jgi:hypothetical protein
MSDPVAGDPLTELDRRGRRSPIRRGPLLAAVALAVVVAGTSAAVVWWTSPHTASPSALSQPSPRSGAAMAYDPAARTVVLFSGVGAGAGGGALLDDTWTWNGSGWTELHPASAPPFRSGGMLAYAPATRQLVLTGSEFPGYEGATPLGNTWTWDGTTWSRQAATGPSTFGWTAMATDDATGQLILVDGFGSGCQAVQTWEWSGGSWLQLRPPASPGPSDTGLLAYDPVSHRLDLVIDPLPACAIDQSAAGLAADWSWDGSDWISQGSALPRGSSPWSGTLVSSAKGPLLVGSEGDSQLWVGRTWSDAGGAPAPARVGAAVAYDAADQQVVLFGGACLSCKPAAGITAYLGDTWTWDGSWTLREGPVR